MTGHKPYLKVHAILRSLSARMQFCLEPLFRKFEIVNPARMLFSVRKLPAFKSIRLAYLWHSEPCFDILGASFDNLFMLPLPIDNLLVDKTQLCT